MAEAPDGEYANDTELIAAAELAWEADSITHFWDDALEDWIENDKEEAQVIFTP